MVQVWQNAAQMRNELKKKAKPIVEEAYHLGPLKRSTKRLEAIASWLCQAHKHTLKSGEVVKVPNFIFPVGTVGWEGKTSINEQVSGEYSVHAAVIADCSAQKSSLNRKKPFGHPVIGEIIYTFWFSGGGQRDLKAPRTSSSKSQTISSL